MKLTKVNDRQNYSITAICIQPLRANIFASFLHLKRDVCRYNDYLHVTFRRFCNMRKPAIQASTICKMFYNKNDETRLQLQNRRVLHSN